MNLDKFTNILIIEDDQLTRLSLNSMLKSYGTVSEASTFEDALSKLETNSYDIVFIDLDLEHELQGLKLIKKACAKNSYVIVLSGREEEQYIEDAYLEGCHDYLCKPFKKSSLEFILKKFKSLSCEENLREFFSKHYITQDEVLLDDLAIINEIIVSDRPVLFQGPTGTGKTLLAKLIHGLIFTDDESFIHLNCSEVPENLLESELFGYEKGAFSGAEKRKKGKIELAHNGTLFLDEIGTMPLATQKKLLKVLEDKTFYPLGSEVEVQSNFRLMSATCDNLKTAIAEKSFREDFYYRIEGFNIFLRGLSERKGDIFLLIHHFIKKGQRRIILSKEVKDILYNYNWPGNVRELERLIDVLRVKSTGIIKKDDLSKELLSKCNDEILNEENSNSNEEVSFLEEFIKFARENGLKKLVEKIEREVVEAVYLDNGKKVRKTLDDLQISNSAFYRIKGEH